MGGMPPGGPGMGPQKSKKKELPKLVDEKNGAIVRKTINIIYRTYLTGVRLFRGGLWFVGCMGIMYLFPLFMIITN